MDAPMPEKQNAPKKRARSRMDVALSEEDDLLPRKKTRRGRKRTRGPKTWDGSDTEMIDIGDDGDDNDNDEGGGGNMPKGPRSRDGPQSHQLRFYKGEKKNLIDIALFFIRLYLLNVNAFPDVDDLLLWSRNAFTAACKAMYGAKYQCMCFYLSDLWSN